MSWSEKVCLKLKVALVLKNLLQMVSDLRKTKTVRISYCCFIRKGYCSGCMTVLCSL